MGIQSGIISGLTLVLYLAYYVQGYPDGAPVEQCSGMQPMHGFDQQSSGFPYTISLSRTTYCPSTEILVTLGGDVKFKGFLCQPRKSVDVYETPGTLVNFDQTGKTVNKCVGKSTLTQKYGTDRLSMTFKWKPDMSTNDTVYIVCTVVKEKKTFWMKQSSAAITFKGADACSGGLLNACSDNETCDDAVSGSVCNTGADTDGDCVCPSHMKMEDPTDISCSKKVLHDECTADSDCVAIAETECTTAGTCACKSAYTAASSDGPCLSKVLDKACTSNDECTDATHTFCDTGKCKCVTGYAEDMQADMCEITSGAVWTMAVSYGLVYGCLILAANL